MTKVTQISYDQEGGSGRRRIHLREISGDSESPLETVGQDLRAARLRRGDDLATVSRALKIRKDHLEAVEEDNFAGLPGKTYAIGFVRSYAGYLGLNTTELVERYKQEISGRREEHLPTDPSLHADEPRRLPYGWRIVAGIVGLALIYGVWHLVSAGYTPQPVPPAPSLNPPRPQVVAAVKPPVPSTPAPSTGVSATPPPAASSIPAQTSTQTQPPKPSAATSGLSSSGVASTGPTASPAPAVPTIAANGATGQTSGQVYGRYNGNSRVMLRAHGETRITVKGPDGTTYVNRDLRAGDSYQVPDVGGLLLAISDAGAVDVVLDGTDIGKVGQNQEVLGRVSLDPQSLVDRYNSH
jgi:cytoskeleton protein RodZ